MMKNNYSVLFFLIFNCFSFPLLHGFEQLKIKIIGSYPHDTSSFTQGLIADQDCLYESCGLYEQSKIRKIDWKSGVVLQEVHIPPNCFGEGIAFCGNRLIQLTWKESKALIFDRLTLKLIGEINYQGEGWGLAADQGMLWMSNGSSCLFQRDPSNLAITKTIDVKLDGHPIYLINDLVVVNNFIYANVWKEDIILKIDKSTGNVNGVIYANNLLTTEQKKGLGRESFLNGITWRKETQTFFITGKNWPFLFEVQFIPLEASHLPNDHFSSLTR